jgi:hypothetical protein
MLIAINKRASIAASDIRAVTVTEDGFVLVWSSLPLAEQYDADWTAESDLEPWQVAKELRREINAILSREGERELGPPPVLKRTAGN